MTDESVKAVAAAIARMTKRRVVVLPFAERVELFFPGEPRLYPDDVRALRDVLTHWLVDKGYEDGRE